MLNWTVAIDKIESKYELTFETNSAYTLAKNYTENLYVTQDSGYRMFNSRPNLSIEDAFYLRLDSYRESALTDARIKLEFDPSHLQFKRISAQKSTRDSINKPESIIVHSNSVELVGVTTKQDLDTLLRLVKFHFEPIKAGSTEVLLYVNESFLFTFPIF